MNQPEYYRLLEKRDAYVAGDIEINGRIFRRSKQLQKIWSERKILCDALHLASHGPEAFKAVDQLMHRMSMHQTRLEELNREFGGKLDLIEKLDDTMRSVRAQVRAERMISKGIKKKMNYILDQLQTKRKIIKAQRKVINKLRRESEQTARILAKQNLKFVPDNATESHIKNPSEHPRDIDAFA
jgi:chromosome segregation ATPase